MLHYFPQVRLAGLWFPRPFCLPGLSSLPLLPCPPRVAPPQPQPAASAHVGAPRRVPGAPVCPLYLNVPCPSPAPRAACLQTIPWARGSAIPETGLAMKTKKVAPDATGTPFQCPLSPDPLPHAGVRRVEVHIPFKKWNMNFVNKLQHRKSPTKSISTEKNQNILQRNQCVTSWTIICLYVLLYLYE